MGDGGSGGSRRLGRRGLLQVVGGGLVGGTGCLDQRGVRRVNTVSGSSRQVTLEYVDVAGARSRSVFQPAINELNQQYVEDITLDYREIRYEDLLDWLRSAVNNGTTPDVAAIDQVWLGEFIDGGAIAPLNGVADDFDFDDYVDAFADPVTERGGIYGLPITTDVRGLYWNKRILERAGLDPKQPPGTWSELVAMSKQVHNPPETYGAGFLATSGRFTVPLFTAGGRILDNAGRPAFHEQAGVDAAAFIQRLHQDAGVTPQTPVHENGTRMAKEFLRGKYAFNVVEGSWLDYFWRQMGGSEKEFVNQFGFAPVPNPADGEIATMSGGFVWAVPNDAEHPAVARDFLRIVASRDFKRHLAVETESVPTRESLLVLDVPPLWNAVLYSDVVERLLKHTHTRPVRNWTTVQRHLDPALRRVAAGEAAPRSALETAARRVRSSLD